MAAKIFERTSLVPAGVDQVWARVVTPEGINDEMRPWMTMTMPRAARGLTVETVPVGQPLGRAWLRLFGVVPFDYDHLTIAQLEPGRRFHEVSTMLSMRQWEHERTLTAVGDETEVRDRITFEPRLPVPGLAAILARVLRAFFGHRHRRLVRHFS
ncbi:SRPBCC family protein [Aeromicrobium terrae]|uniref:SRPBCC family protein n=1 Tax=Aeromicrobium terrae TaxID=2498846 RepID=A0A5C8NEY0_9ACTN|nr:hypothetical protein [Aeromicrobium terrae]TXL57365.1 hypothetical protein FHP06_15115 [Aeromicrobium terrae]